MSDTKMTADEAREKLRAMSRKEYSEALSILRSYPLRLEKIWCSTEAEWRDKIVTKYSDDRAIELAELLCPEVEK